MLTLGQELHSVHPYEKTKNQIFVTPKQPKEPRSLKVRQNSTIQKQENH